jgi:hypothetical protein
MTTVIFLESQFDTSTGTSSVSLREWLGQHWAILFSHPDDFDQEQLERDRWIRVLERRFTEQAVKPLALARQGHDAQLPSLGWLDELGDGCAAQVSIAIPLEGTAHDFRATTLRAQILHSDTRFAMVIDSDLLCRQAVRYRAAIDLPSPLDLLGWAVALRERNRCDSDCRSNDRMVSLLPVGRPARRCYSARQGPT